MDHLVPPHGGKLKPLLLETEERRAHREEARGLAAIPMNSREVSDVIMLGTGSFSPLEGFMVRKDYEGVVRQMRLSYGTMWPIPVTLAVSREKASGLKEGQRIALLDPERDEVMALMTVEEKFPYDRKGEARGVFGTEDEAHPGVQKIYEQGDVYLGGPVKVLSEGGYPEKYPEYARPRETREIFSRKGWETVAAFQTRNPIHRSHEYLTKIAMEVCDGVFIHPIVGKLKEGDIPAEVRMRCYKTIIENYYPKERVVLNVYPMEMRYAGPKEALLHAIIRQNFGCSHMIVGRDHAGVGKYYGPFDAHKIFDQLEPDDLYLQPLKMDWTFWCSRCESVVSTKTCPHPDSEHLMISGTELRAMLARGERPPKEFGRPEVMDILIEYYSQRR
ncbi:MAG TPA: sulfate adenylyltransferase [Spirochaetia bacterium]|nr:sulfate adenylyltransferase [Spirochaetia bacterium]